jgi:hypothetical protein
VFPRVTEPHLLVNTANATKAGGNPRRAVLVTLALLDPQARYTLELDPTGPTEKPPIIREVGTEFLSEQDVDKLVWGVNTVRALQRTYPLNQASPTLLS